jgi:CRISPR-associated exonuclease Cas4
VPSDPVDGGGLPPVPLSALQHYSYCPRQCALAYIEQAWDENLLTVRGGLAHVRADEYMVERNGAARTVHALPLSCERLGLTGKADVVEFQPGGAPYPVEYKHGKRHQRVHDDLQLCAQALCLEEMYGLPVPRGAIFHISSRRRRVVEFTPALRQRVVETAEAVRAMLLAGGLPPPANDSRCRNCSLIEICQPGVNARQDWSALRRALFHPPDNTGSSIPGAEERQ